MEDSGKEDAPEEKLDKRKKVLKEKILTWFKNPYNLLLFAIFLALIILRFYYFWITRNQAVWWDESEYLSAAKSFAGIVHYQLLEQRMPGYPLLMSVFFSLGISNEVVLRLIFNFIPSIIAIFLFYFLIKEMYLDKRIILISVIIFGLLWEHLFYSNRFHTENLSLIFELLAILVLFKVYMKKEPIWIIKPKFSLIWIIIFSVISVIMRPGNVPFFPALALFVILLNQNFFYDEKHKKSFLIALFVLIAIAIIVFLNLSKIPLIRAYYHPNQPVSWEVLGVFDGFYSSVVPNLPPILLYAFLLGLVIVVGNVLLIIDSLKKLNRDSEYLDFKSDVFNILLLLSILIIFMFLVRPRGIEYRWFFILLPAILPLTCKGMIRFSEFIAKLLGTKKIAIFLILIILSLGAYNQWVHADSIIRNKIDSYAQIKDASLWIKENSDKGGIVLSRSLPQTIYYSERDTYTFALLNESNFFKIVKEKKPTYMLESALEPNPGTWGYSPTEKMMRILEPVQGWYLDPAKTQLAVIVYKINFNENIINQPFNQAQNTTKQ